MGDWAAPAAGGVRRLKGLLTVTALWILLGMLPLALLTSSSITLSEQAVRSEVRDRVETTASVSRVVVEQQMGSLKQLVSAFAQRPEVRRAVLSGSPAARSALAGYLKELAHMRGGVSGVIVIGPDGYMIGAEPPSGLPQDVSTTDWYLAVRGRNQAYVSQAYTPTMRGVSRAVAVAAPIPAAAGGELLGVLAVVYSLDAIQDFTSQAAEAQGIRLLITDQSGVLVADPWGKVYALTSLREDPRVDAALAGRSLFTGFDGAVLSASEPIPGIGWTVTAEVPTAEALVSAATLRMRVLSVAAVLAVLIVAGLAVQIRTTRGRRRAQDTLARYAEALAAARDEAVSASLAKTEFLAKVSHEIRTPINGVLGMNGLLLGTRMDDEQRHYAGTVQASAQNLLRLLDDFLDLSKIEAGRLEAEAVPFDLPRLCDEVVAPLAPHAYRQGLWLTLRLDDDVPQHVVGDPVRLRQVLSNLIGNALKFTVQGGVDLEVALEPAGEVTGDDHVTLRFAVTDTGVGVGPDDKSRVFEIFRQVDSPITRRTGGSGLGLAISRQLTELMGGRIGLDSMEGIGSRFHLTLPVDVLTWSAPASAALRERRVLIADAQQEDRASAGRILAGAGLVAEQAQDAAAALATLRAAADDGHPFDLAVVDLDMNAVPEADEPVSLADAILSDPLLRATNVVVLVTPGRTGSIWPGVSAAPDRVVQSMTRPLSRRRLLAAVENTLSTAGRDDESGVSEVASRPEPVRILVAEDDEVSREVARLVLRKAGHRVDVVGDGEQAVRAVLSGDYDLVFMDCQLPVLDGLAATADIRRRQERPGRIPIIAMTAAAMPDDRVRCLEAGMNAHLTKPVDWQHVLGQIPVWVSPEIPAELEGLSAEDVADIAQAFLSSVPGAFRELREAVGAGDPELAGSLAHRLGGSCATVGAARAAELCHRVEEAPAMGAVSELAEELERVSDEMTRLARGRELINGT